VDWKDGGTDEGWCGPLLGVDGIGALDVPVDFTHSESNVSPVWGSVLVRL